MEGGGLRAARLAHAGWQRATRSIPAGVFLLLAVLTEGPAANAAPQLEGAVGIGSALELGGGSPVIAPGFLCPRVALLSRGPMLNGSTALLLGVAVPVSIESDAVGVQPAIGILRRPSIDFAYGLIASAIFGVEPVGFGILEAALEGRYYLTVGTALSMQAALDLVLANETRVLLGGVVGLTVDFDLAGQGS